MQELALDRQWRVRLAILEHTPLLAKHLSEDEFTNLLWPNTVKWLGDPVFVVREAAILNIKKLADILGADWAERNVLEHLNPGLLTHMNYLLRVTAVCCYGKLIDVFPARKAEELLLPCILEKGLEDEVPNVRFRVAKSLPEIAERFISGINGDCDPASGKVMVREKILPVVELLEQDRDRDVRDFAVGARTEIAAKC